MSKPVVDLSRQIASSEPVVRLLLPAVAVMFAAYLVVGLAMPVLPLHVHEELGLNTFIVGLVAGSQFAASFISRFWAGNHADSRGAKHAVVIGLAVAGLAGLFYGLSLLVVHHPEMSVALLLLGRALLGGAESFIAVGVLIWGLARVGTKHTGTVMSWVGTAMYVAFAIGAPLGNALYTRYGFIAIAAATALVPLGALLFVAPMRAIIPNAAPTSRSFTKVIGAVWMPGIGLALSSIGFGAITTFIALLFASRGWGPAWSAFTTVSIFFVLGRLLFGHLPDRLGGAKVALIFAAIETAGQALIWLASMPVLVLLGCAPTGFGYSLVYPGFGVEAVRGTAPESRGLVIGAYTAFLDLALGFANPALGLIAGVAGLGSVFLVSSLAVAGAVIIATRLLVARRAIA